LIVLGAGLLVSYHVGGVIDSVRQDVSVEAFFPQDASQEQMDEVRSRVEEYPQVSEVNFVSKEEGLERFKETYSDRPELYEGLGSDFIQASLQIKLKDTEAGDAVASNLRDEGFADEDVTYPQQTIERLNEVTDYMIWGLRAATALFLISSVLLISNTIRISIFARRKEIEVMKLVGASDGFVRTPFVFEGLVQGLTGAGLAAIVVVWLNYLFVEWSQGSLPFVPISSGAVNTPLVLLILVAVGAAIGIVGSFLSVTRFLKI
jgi:cell division transport system permease protein